LLEVGTADSRRGKKKTAVSLFTWGSVHRLDNQSAPLAGRQVSTAGQSRPASQIGAYCSQKGFFDPRQKKIDEREVLDDASVLGSVKKEEE